MMKQIAKYTAAALVLFVLALAGCTQYAESEPQLPAAPSGGEGVVTIRSAMLFPEAVEASTRAQLGENPDYEHMSLYCVVFQDNGRPSSNYMIRVVEATHYPEKAYSDPAHPERRLVPFEVSLPATSENVIIHFIALDNRFDDTYTNPLGELDFGPENYILPRLTTSAGHDAYWQRIALGCPISHDTEQAIADIISVASPVPLVRNFAKISVELAPELAQKGTFELVGFVVVNTLDRGTITPYSETYGYPQFVDLEDDRRPYTYNEIKTGKRAADASPIPGTPYEGTRPAGWKMTNTEVPSDLSAYTLDPKYIYERPFNETNHTYIIVAGRYSGSTLVGSGSGRLSFYKLDLGNRDSRGLFVFCNLLRNFNFKMVIKDVEIDGYPTTEAAAAGQIYNNNISAAVETQHLLSISDGHDMMYVNFTSYVIVDKNEKIYLRYRYFDDIPETGEVRDEDQSRGVVNWDDPEVGVRTGSVIASWKKNPDFKDEIKQGDNVISRTWSEIEITPQEPTDELQMQQVTLFRQRDPVTGRDGLSRTITLFLCNPWKLSDVETYAALADTREDARTEAAGKGFDEGEVAGSIGEPLTIFFDLPIGLPKAMFPLEFVIEADKQNIENDKSGEKVVRSAPSLFEEASGPNGERDYRIQYVRTVRWEEYYNADTEEYFTLVHNLFSTTTDLSALEPNQTTTRIRIYNRYFEMAQTDFTRNQ